jgi:hypothetical protein
MEFLKLTKNIGGKVIRINPDYIIEIEEGQVDEDPEVQPKGKTPATDKKEKQKKAVTIIRRTKGKDLFVIETPEEISAQLLNIQDIKAAADQLAKRLTTLHSSLQTPAKK